ncbi:MAG: cell division protein SepF [Candidatus Baldrarchaeia archaeon]|nr:cell division protein SepF [Candidatus Baldrarchaeota archaeon]
MSIFKKILKPSKREEEEKKYEKPEDVVKVLEELKVFETKEDKVTSETEELEMLSEIYLKTISLSDLSDVKYVEEELKHGNIIILNIYPLVEESPVNCKRAIERLRAICKVLNGNMRSLGGQYIIITPHFIKIKEGKKKG